MVMLIRLNNSHKLLGSLNKIFSKEINQSGLLAVFAFSFYSGILWTRMNLMNTNEVYFEPKVVKEKKDDL